MKTKKIAIVGAGFGGATVARILAEQGDVKIDVFDMRPHVAGNCHTARDPKTGVMVHVYGPHIFHTSREDVWSFVNRFGAFGPYTNRVKALTKRGVFSLPINLLTINQFFNKTFDPAGAAAFIKGIGDKNINEPKNFEEQALKFLGRELYENFFLGYTRKQWGMNPTELPASILQRLPVRFNYDDNYFNDKYQGIPFDGYTAMIEKMLKHDRISLTLNHRFDIGERNKYDHVFYSGTIDGFFGYKLGKLRYRTLEFEEFTESGDFQGNAVLNYCEESYPFTRISEHKHFAPWEQHEKTICFREFSRALDKDSDVPFYPLRLAADKKLLDAYAALAKQEENITFIGRLGTYRYLDMHVVIGESLDMAHAYLKADPKKKFMAFSNI
jgi:UDP-galactopyranose mutase